MGGHLSYIAPVAEFTDGGSSNTVTAPAAATALGTDAGGDAISDAVIPALYGMWKVNPDLALGLAINVPYGLQTDYDATWIGRYHALKSDLRTISVQPAVAYRVTPQLSLGAGVNVQHASAELTRAVDFGSVNSMANTLTGGNIGINGGGGDGLSKVEGDDLSYGFTLSALYELSEQTRVGAHYRSRVHHELDGDLAVTNKPTYSNPLGVPAIGALASSLNANFADGGASAELRRTAPISASITS